MLFESLLQRPAPQVDKVRSIHSQCAAEIDREIAEAERYIDTMQQRAGESLLRRKLRDYLGE